MPNKLPKLATAALACAGVVHAETHRVAPQTYYHTFSHANPPAARIQGGDVVITRTLDSAGQDEKAIQRSDGRIHPLTGPFYVDGAEPGDAVLGHFRRGRPNR